jgi:hypothetical protein
MKAIATRKDNVFEPITLTITIESQEELEAIYQTGNHSNSVGELVHDRDPQVSAKAVETVTYALYSAVYEIRNS